jgi:hypothetical protein
MTWLSDEVLSAYIDGELQPAEAARVALALTRDPDAVRRLNALRESDAMLREAFDWPLPGQASLTDDVSAKMENPSPWRRPAPIAAVAGAGVVMAAAAGFAIGQLSAPREVALDTDRGAFAEGALGKALESQAGDVNGPLRIVLTFRAKDGRFCRQFWAAAAGLAGVACRDDKGWRIEELSAEADPAGGDRAPAGTDSPVERAVTLIGVDQPLDLTQEARLIASGWRVPGAPASGKGADTSSGSADAQR